MGVPAFFRWLSSKYPSIVSHCVEKRGAILDNKGNRAPVDSTEPNPNGQEFDILYLDMNGIIHPCTHPENKPAPKNEAEMFVAIFEYIDRLFAIIRPRRVLYMAIDGVAPRAKMNQQRSRRFRASKETKEKLITLDRLREELINRGAYLPSTKSASEHFDSNCITPGTPFMARLAVALRYYIYERLSSDPGWKNLMIFLSDANVPGEGEHKIMDFIRRQRNSPDHDANTRHCLCGADADLIMLGLATHEPHFTIIREEFKPDQPRPCELCGQIGHQTEDCVGTPRPEEIVGASGDAGDDDEPVIAGAEPEFIFIHLSVLRQYLEKDLTLTGITFEWDLERVIDDWVFMCFFVGNDFLPHLPSLEIREGAIDRLIEIYKSTVQQTGGWLTDSGRVHMERVQLIMTELGKMEDEIFQKRRDSELTYRRRKKERDGSGPQRTYRSGSWNTPPNSGLLQPVPLNNPYGVAHPRGRFQGTQYTASQVHQARHFSTYSSGNSSNSAPIDWVDRNLNNLEAATAMKAMLKPRRSGEKSGPGGVDAGDYELDGAPGAQKPRLDNLIPSERKGRLGGAGAEAVVRKVPKDAAYTEDDVADANDEVRLWEDGWRSRYYQSKFGVDPSDAPEFCIQVGQEYAKGLCWVLAYYYQGCVSWDWYFPYHYAPFASDFVGIGQLDPGFDRVKTQPFRPLEQLMGVFPADSRSHVPPVWQDLMTDPDSPIIDFYPTNFKVDLNGKRYLWMGVALLPFVDEVRLLRALDARRRLLTPEELARNVRGPDRLFCRTTHPVHELFASLYDPVNKEVTQSNGKQTVDNVENPRLPFVVPTHASVLDARLTEGVSGRVWADWDCVHLPGKRVPSGVPSLLPDLPSSQAISVCFSDPAYPEKFVFQAELLKSVKLPAPAALQPPTRGRGRGRGRSGFNNSDNSTAARFNRDSAMRHYARDSSSDRSESHSYSPSPMERMIHNALPPRGQPRPSRPMGYPHTTSYGLMTPSAREAPTRYTGHDGYARHSSARDTHGHQVYSYKSQSSHGQYQSSHDPYDRRPMNPYGQYSVDVNPQFVRPIPPSYRGGTGSSTAGSTRGQRGSHGAPFMPAWRPRR